MRRPLSQLCIQGQDRILRWAEVRWVSVRGADGKGLLVAAPSGDPRGLLGFSVSESARRPARLG